MTETATIHALILDTRGVTRRLSSLKTSASLSRQDQLVPGAHIVAVCADQDVDAVTLTLRLAGLEIRDTIFVYRDNGTITAVLARVPLDGTVVGNVLGHSAGALNIDACRTVYESGGTKASNPSLRETISGGNGGHVFPAEKERRVVVPHSSGRWPANVLLDSAAGASMDAQSGVSVSRAGKPRTGVNGNGWGMTATGTEHNDSGGASRFFGRVDSDMALFDWLEDLITPPNGTCVVEKWT